MLTWSVLGLKHTFSKSKSKSTRVYFNSKDCGDCSWIEIKIPNRRIMSTTLKSKSKSKSKEVVSTVLESVTVARLRWCGCGGCRWPIRVVVSNDWNEDGGREVKSITNLVVEGLISMMVATIVRR